MKAAVYHGPPGSWPEKPLSIEEVPRPVPGPKEVLVKVAACGLCHTDVTVLRGAPIVNEFPIILGHEPSGLVTEVGAEVRTIQPGQRVIVSSNFPCLTCDECRSGKENQCDNSTLIGVNCNGALAEYIVAPETGVYPIPDSLSLEESCIVADIVCTAYHAVYNRANVRPGDTVAIYGASGATGLDLPPISIPVVTSYSLSIQLQELVDGYSWHHADVPDYSPSSIAQSISWLLQVL